METSTSRKSSPKLFIAPSSFASYFHFGCERQLIFTAAHVDRAKWFYEDDQSKEYIQYDRYVSVQLEISLQNGDKETILLDGTKINLPARIHHTNGVDRRILRSNWFYIPSSLSSTSSNPRPQPLSEENCHKLDSNFLMPSQPTEVVIGDSTYVAKIDEMLLYKRHFDKPVPENEKPLKLTKWNGLVDSERDALSVAFTSGGDLWESQILDILQADHHLVHMGELPPGAEARASDRKLTLASFINILAQPPSAPLQGREFLYQPALEAPAQLYTKLKLNKTQVTFSKCFPDFIEIHRATSSEGKEMVELTIVDAKATDHMKLSHRIQVGIYYFIIDALLEAHQLKDRVKIKDIGGVWLRGKKDYETFDLAPVITYLLEFWTQGTWKQLYDTPLPQISPQMSKKCAHCSFVDFCKKEAFTNEKELSYIYGVTSYEKKYVQNFLEDQGHVGVQDEPISIEEIYRHLQSHTRPRIAPTSENASSHVIISSEDSSQGLAAPSTPSRGPKRTEPRTPSSIPSTPNSTQETQEYDLMSPTKPEEPPSPFPLRSNSDINIDPHSQATQLFDDAPSAFIETNIPLSSHSKKPLNHNLWMSMMKIQSFLSHLPVVLHQPSTQLSVGEDISIALSIVWDRPNGHLLGWSITTRLLSPTAQKRKNDLFSSLGALHLPFTSVTQLLENNTHISSMLGEILNEKDGKIAQLTETLIKALFSVVSFISTTLPKATTKLFIFTPTEYDNLSEILLPFAKGAKFHPKNSNDHDPTCTVSEMALHLLTTLYQLPSSIALPHQTHFKNAAPPCLGVLKPMLNSLLALPLPFDADFDDFHRVLCQPIDREKYIPPKDKFSQKGILTEWYQMVKSNPTSREIGEGISHHFHAQFSIRACMIFDVLDSIRCLVGGIDPPLLKGGNFKPVDKIETTRESLLIGKAKALGWNSYIPSCDPSISKLLFANSFDMLGDAKKKMNDRLTIAFRESFQMEDRVVALRCHSSYLKQRPRSTVTIYVFEFDYMSESLASALQQDINDPKTERWLFANNTDKGIRSALDFDDYRHATPAVPGFKFVPPAGLGFATPQEFSVSSDGKRLLHLSINTKKIDPPVEGQMYYLSEFMVDLTSDILRTCLGSLDLRIGFMKALSKLRNTASKAGEALIVEKQSVNQFLGWLLQIAQSSAKPAETSLFAHPLDLEFFERMGGLSTFFLEFASRTVDPESLPADLDLSQLQISPSAGLPTLANPTEIERAQDRVKLNYSSSAPKNIGECLAWAIEEFQGIQAAGTAVPRAILDDPIGWGKHQPGDFKDQSIEISRAQTLAELVSAHEQLTPAQHEIFKAVLCQKLTCVWGPPGTGKTYFLANLLLLLLESHRTMTMKEVTIVEATPKKRTAKATGKSTSAKKSSSTSPEHPADPVKELAQDLQQKLQLLPPEDSNEKAPEPTVVRQLVASGTPFCIMVVAFTHRSIDNLLERFLSVESRFRATFAAPGSEIPNVNLPVGRMFSDKAGKSESPEISDLHSAAELRDFMISNPQCVIGATVWALRKYSLPTTAFQMLVVDEASQLLLSQCVVASQWLLPGGRMVVVGDHEQLPPISNTVYPDLPHLTSSTQYALSVFEYLQLRDKLHCQDPNNRSITQMLAENWRSNATLSSIPSATIYASKDPKRHYYPAKPEIANQKFWLQSRSEDQLPGIPTMFRWVPKPELPLVPVAHPLLQLMFDANRPFGVVMLHQAEHGVSLDSFPQAPLIACLASAVRQASEYLFPTENDQQFWNSKLLIVAPHHAQRHRIRDHLMDPSPEWHVNWDSKVNPAIETVEKAQGRQFTSVIVDYGIIDNFRISKELSFLYSRNRINVSQTRAESKCIFFVSDAMLKMTPNIYSSRGIQQGFSYLQYIVKWARERHLVHDVNTSEIGSMCATLEQDPFFKHMAQIRASQPRKDVEDFAIKTPSKPRVSAKKSMATTASEPSPSATPDSQAKNVSAAAISISKLPPEDILDTDD